MSEARLRSSIVGLRRQSMRCYEEGYPEAYKKADRNRFEERLKALGKLIEEISEVDEESARISDCSSSTLNLEGRSPYALPIEERIWHNSPRYQNPYFAHLLVGSQIVRRSHSGRPLLERGFSEPALRRKRSQFVLGDRRSGGSFEQLTIDFLNLPPIPETVPLQLGGEKVLKYDGSGTDYDDSSECSDFNSSS